MVRDGSAQPASPTILAGTPGDGDVVRHRLHHHRARGDARAMADLDIAENFRAGADQHAAADLRMAVLVLLAGAAERHAVQDRDVVLDHRGLADDEAGGVIEEDAAADLGGGIDVGLEHRRGAALQVIGKILAALVVEPVRQAMGLDRVEALEVEQRIDEARRRGIAVVDRHQSARNALPISGSSRSASSIGLADQVARQRRMVEPLGDAMHDRILKPLMMQHGRIDEGGKLRFAADDVFGLAAGLRPRSDRAKPVSAPCGLI